tara:strand:- start:1934 stop:2737 length:804 start_codon:yes stop_codon:yes gene_type:complete
MSAHRYSATSEADRIKLTGDKLHLATFTFRVPAETSHETQEAPTTLDPALTLAIEGMMSGSLVLRGQAAGWIHFFTEENSLEGGGWSKTNNPLKIKPRNTVKDEEEQGGDEPPEVAESSTTESGGATKCYDMPGWLSTWRETCNTVEDAIKSGYLGSKDEICDADRTGRDLNEIGAKQACCVCEGGKKTKCNDIPGWLSTWGDTCNTVEDAIKNGVYQSCDAEWTGRDLNGIGAKQACCVCWGGDEDSFTNMGVKNWRSCINLLLKN